MLKVGITGGIGSGKTTVCKIFSLLGVPVYNADSAAKDIINSDKQLVSELKKAFGKKIYNKRNKVIKNLFAEIIFGNKGNLQRANSLIHPAVRKDFASWLKKNSSAPYVIKEAAILFESGAHSGLDYVITVTAPEKLRIKRVMIRDGKDEKHVKSIMQNQMSEKKKKSNSDFIIVNDDNELVIPQVVKLHKQFLSLRSKK